MNGKQRYGGQTKRPNFFAKIFFFIFWPYYTTFANYAGKAATAAFLPTKQPLYIMEQHLYNLAQIGREMGVNSPRGQRLHTFMSGKDDEALTLTELNVLEEIVERKYSETIEFIKAAKIVAIKNQQNEEAELHED